MLVYKCKLPSHNSVQAFWRFLQLRSAENHPKSTTIDKTWRKIGTVYGTEFLRIRMRLGRTVRSPFHSGVPFHRLVDRNFFEYFGRRGYSYQSSWSRSGGGVQQCSRNPNVNIPLILSGRVLFAALGLSTTLDTLEKVGVTVSSRNTLRSRCGQGPGKCRPRVSVRFVFPSARSPKLESTVRSGANLVCANLACPGASDFWETLVPRPKELLQPPQHNFQSFHFVLI